MPGNKTKDPFAIDACLRATVSFGTGISETKTIMLSLVEFICLRCCRCIAIQQNCHVHVSSKSNWR